MKFSTRTRYGTKALLELALHGNGELVPLKDIASRQQIPLPYLAHIMGPLIQGGIVKSIRGTGGGLMLIKSPRKIVLSEVMPLLESTLSPVQCVDKPETCPHSNRCVTYDLWDEVKDAINKVFESITLQDLVERQHSKVQNIEEA